jgi:hypothetical protein
MEPSGRNQWQPVANVGAPKRRASPCLRVLNIVFLGLAASLIWRYFHYGGGLAMLRTMNNPHARARARWQLTR